MQVIVNKEQKDLTISYEGTDYIFRAGKPVQVEDNIYEYLKELLPLSFDFKPDLKKIKSVDELHTEPTKVVFPGGKFGIQSANISKVRFPNQNIDETPADGKIDKDGVEFYGRGLEDDKP